MSAAHDREWSRPAILQVSDMCVLQVLKPYNSPYTLPIPASARPAAVTTALLVNYTQAGSGGVMALADATSDFALRFMGDRPLPSCRGLPLRASTCMQAQSRLLGAAP